MSWLIMDTRQIVGNCALFWGPDGAGYTCELADAGRYTEAEAKSQAAERSTDVAVPLEVAERHSRTHVRVDCGLWTELADLAVGQRPILDSATGRCKACGQNFHPGDTCSEAAPVGAR